MACKATVSLQLEACCLNAARRRPVRKGSTFPATTVTKSSEAEPRNDS